MHDPPISSSADPEHDAVLVHRAYPPLCVACKCKLTSRLYRAPQQRSVPRNCLPAADVTGLSGCGAGGTRHLCTHSVRAFPHLVLVYPPLFTCHCLIIAFPPCFSLFATTHSRVLNSKAVDSFQRVTSSLSTGWPRAQRHQRRFAQDRGGILPPSDTDPPAKKQNVTRSQGKEFWPFGFAYHSRRCGI